ncbi:MAG: hypothetical protein Q9178_004743 [Gyalolechia marmorata]
MQLGTEWNTEEFTNRLALLAFEHGACWIDQLCIPQKDAEIRKALASIPTIYRTFDVIVLMPGAPCNCVHEALETLEVAYEFGSESEYNSVVNAIEPDARCVKLGSLLDEDHHYTTAEHALDLPTFARLVYQQAAQAAKANSAFFGEPFGVETVKNAVLKGSSSALVGPIPSFANATVESVLSRRIYGNTEAGRIVCEKAEEGRRLIDASQENMTDLSDKVATKVVGVSVFNDYRSALTALREYLGGWEEASGKGSIVRLRTFQFFAGKVIENGSEDPRLTNEMSQLQRFLDGLNGLRGSGRTSTQAKNYVSSIWADCPQYEMAVDYEDHLARYPTEFMFRSIKRVRSHTKAAYEPSNSLQGPGTVGRLIASFILVFVSNFVRASLGGRETFHSEMQERRSKAKETLDTRMQEENDKEGFRHKLLDHRISQWDSAAEINYFQVVYKMVTDSLGVDHDVWASLIVLSPPGTPEYGPD